MRDTTWAASSSLMQGPMGMLSSSSAILNGEAEMGELPVALLLMRGDGIVDECAYAISLQTGL